MPHYILRIPVETLRDEDTMLIAYEGIPKHIDVKVMASTPVDAMKLLAQVLGALVVEVQKGKIILLNEK